MSKERPILFSGPMVRAILEGRKTQTRRVVRLPKDASPYAELHHIDLLGNAVFTDGSVVRAFAQAGTRLWVRETWSGTGMDVVYKSDDLSSWRQLSPWRPSIHMPRWASRITLEVTGVRVERLQDISEEDAKAEGVTLKGTSRYDGEARDAFESLWCSINGAESWDANPWVWCVSFRKL